MPAPTTIPATTATRIVGAEVAGTGRTSEANHGGLDVAAIAVVRSAVVVCIMVTTVVLGNRARGSRYSAGRRGDRRCFLVHATGRRGRLRRRPARRERHRQQRGHC